MSHPADKDITPGSIINQPQHPYHIAHPGPPGQAHPQQLPQHGQHQPQHQYLGQVPPFNSHGDAIHPYQSAFPVAPPYTRSAFNDFRTPSYAAVPSGDLVHQISKGPANSPSATEPPHKPTWVSEIETSSHQKDGFTGAAQSMIASTPSYEPAMRYIKNPLDVLNAEQYVDDGYPSRRGLSKSNAHAHVFATVTGTPNSKKRVRNGSRNEQAEPVEEIKRARGRPRLETGDHQDMKERRKEQIRLAQRAYRNRKETAITDLEAKVTALEASNAETNATFQSLIVDYVDKNPISAQDPELRRRIQQFQATLAQRCSDVAGTKSDEATSDDKQPANRASQPNQPELGAQLVVNGTTSPITQESQQLLGGLIVTHEPQSYAVGQELVQTHGSSLEDASYTYVKMPNFENASFGFNMSFSDSPMQAQWSFQQWESLPMPASGAFLERTFSRKLHRRTTEKAAKLLAMENPPWNTMHRVFGFVFNYATTENIRQRIDKVLSRGADEDLNAYSQPFHQIGGSGTHFASNAKTASYPGGAPFQSNGFGMGPFNERTTAVRDELLDALQRTNLPGWQGEWYDSYEVEQFLAQKSINLPQGGDGYVDVPPGEFYENPLADQASSSKDSARGSATRKGTSDFNISDNVGEGLSMHSTEQTMAGNTSYTSPVSNIDSSMLAMPAATDMWPSSDFLSMSQTVPGNMSSLLAYPNAGSTGFPDPSHFGYSPTAMNLVSGQNGSKRVWFSVEKFIDSLGSKGTCVGRGPAFRKKDIVTAFWEAVKPGLD
ncbi:hypothetical protein NUW58_g7978 [Xylaria curta]|uniref:Uncharacterized protein n=1 Tax=Xylaria curta TaxID=42375 RepID=A0ACC1NC65_9PEZI|nr:hypothetical protein NUW58_g7978 [Xylaria curta]